LETEKVPETEMLPAEDTVPTDVASPPPIRADCTPAIGLFRSVAGTQLQFGQFPTPFNSVYPSGTAASESQQNAIPG
jgi:hypothetical protein